MRACVAGTHQRFQPHTLTDHEYDRSTSCGARRAVGTRGQGRGAGESGGGAVAEERRHCGASDGTTQRETNAGRFSDAVASEGRVLKRERRGMEGAGRVPSAAR